jgi:hypothetical protein
MAAAGLRGLVDRGDVGLRVARNTGTNQHGGLVYSALTSTFIERREKQDMPREVKGQAIESDTIE